MSVTHENILNIICQANKIEASMRYYKAMSQQKSNGHNGKDGPSHVRRIWRRWILIDGRGECKAVQLLWKLLWQFLKQLNINLPSNPELPLLGFQLKEMITYVHTNSYMQKFTAVFSKQSQQSQTGNNPNDSPLNR